MAKKTKDMLTNTSQSFTACEDLFNNAIGVVKSTIDMLGSVNERIDNTIQDIDAYQQGLADNRQQLVASKERNATILANFSKLLEVD